MIGEVTEDVIRDEIGEVIVEEIWEVIGEGEEIEEGVEGDEGEWRGMKEGGGG